MPNDKKRLGRPPLRDGGNSTRVVTLYAAASVRVAYEQADEATQEQARKAALAALVAVLEDCAHANVR